MESTMLPAHGVELYRMHPAQPLSDSSNNEEGGGSWNVSSGALDREEFDSRLLDSLVVPFAETELHGPLTQLMTPPPREALAEDKDEFGWLMQTTDTTSGDPRTDCFSLNKDATSLSLSLSLSLSHTHTHTHTYLSLTHFNKIAR
jgi:hypothetical protein